MKTKTVKKSFTNKDIERNIAKMVECFPQLTEGLNLLRKPTDKIAENYGKLAYPAHPNWSYCIPLVPNHTLKDGTVVDIGIHVDPRWIKEYPDMIGLGISANFVTSNDGPDYYSGEIRPTSEMNKVAILYMRHWGIINNTQILQTIGDFNDLLERFLHSDLTLWDLSKFVGYDKRGE